MSTARALAPVPVPRRFETTTRQGMRCTVAPRGKIPLVAVRLLLAGGSAADPPGLEGLTDFVLRLLRRGTKKRTADALDEAIEFVGATLGAGSYEDYAGVSLTTPAEHLDTLLRVLAELMREPRFAPSEVKAARIRTLAELTNDWDDPATVADRALLPALWGDHPYGHDVVGRIRSVRRFTPDVVRRFFGERFGPKNTHLYLVGPVEPEVAQRSVERAFRGWTSPEATLPAPPPVVERLACSGQIWIVDKPEQTQSQLRVGCLAYRRGAPEAHAARVLNAVIGGGFTSRLVTEVRVNRGLSYGVGSTLDPLRSAGSWTISTFTKTESTRELVDVVLSVLKGVREGGVTEAELEHAKGYLAGTYPLRTESNESMAAALSEVDLYGLSADWIENYRARVQAVTLDEVHQVAEQYVLREPPALALVGRAKEIKKQLKGMGEVRVLGKDEVA